MGGRRPCAKSRRRRACGASSARSSAERTTTVSGVPKGGALLPHDDVGRAASAERGRRASAGRRSTRPSSSSHTVRPRARQHACGSAPPAPTRPSARPLCGRRRAPIRRARRTVGRAGCPRAPRESPRGSSRRQLPARPGRSARGRSRSTTRPDRRRSHRARRARRSSRLGPSEAKPTTVVVPRGDEGRSSRGADARIRSRQRDGWMNPPRSSSSGREDVAVGRLPAALLDRSIAGSVAGGCDAGLARRRVGSRAVEFEHVLVVGAGQMGGGIAQVVAASGRRVSLHDPVSGRRRARARRDAAEPREARREGRCRSRRDARAHHAGRRARAGRPDDRGDHRGRRREGGRLPRAPTRCCRPARSSRRTRARSRSRRSRRSTDAAGAA